MHRSARNSLAAIFTLALSLSVTFTAVAVPPSDDSDPLVFESDQGWSLSEVGRLTYGVEVAELVTEYSVNGEVVTVGVFPEAGATSAHIQREILATLTDMTATGSLRVSPASPVLRTYAAALGVARATEPIITRFTLREGSSVSESLSEYRVDAPGVASQSAEESGLAAVAATCVDPWWPNYFQVIAQPSTVAGNRYGRLYFKWRTSARLANLKACMNVTFEPDYATYNYDRLHYFGGTIASWSSNLPDAYWDTAFGDSTDELIYTVGSSTASSLVLNTEYTTYFRANNGNASSDTAKVNAQRGERIPSFCHSTWCIFARDTERFPTSGWGNIPTAGWTISK